MPTPAASMVAIGFVLAMVAIVLWHAAALRRNRWIVVRPKLESVSIEHMPGSVQRLLTYVIGPLNSLGFVLTERVLVRDIASWGSLFQVWFLNREAGDRASIVGIGRSDSPSLVIAFATEFVDGRKVETRWPRPAERTEADTGVESSAADQAVANLYERHKERVAQALSDREQLGLSVFCNKVLPDPGKELEWLDSRTAPMTERFARRLNYCLDRSGRYYRLSWRTACHMVLMTRAKPPAIPRGFDVVPISPDSGNAGETAKG